MQAWIQHGHDGLPQRAGFSVDRVMEVYNAWWEMPEDPHNLELDRVREEMAECDLLIVLDTSGEAGAGATREAVLGAVLDKEDKLGVVTITTRPDVTQGGFLNIFADAEEVFSRLLESLNIRNIPTIPRNICCLHLASAMVNTVFSLVMEMTIFTPGPV